MKAVLAFLGSRTFTSLRSRNYRLFFTAQVLSNVGTWMHLTALSWLILDLTGSALAVGALVVCRTLPHTAFALVAGVVADRVDSRRLVLVTTTVIMTTVGVLAGLTLGGHPAPWQVYALTFTASTAGAFALPNRQAFVIEMVGRDALPNAVALNASVQSAARVVGPAVAGVLIAAVGVGWCFAINALSFVPVLAALLAMRTNELVRPARPSRPRLLGGIAEGIAYARRDRRIALPLGMILVVGALGANFNVLLPVLASERFDAQPETFGLVFSAFGAGALVGALTQASAAATVGRTVGACAGFSLAFLLLVPVHLVAAAVVLVFAAGASFTMWTASNQAMLQLAAPDRLRGRIISLYLFASTGIAPLGALLSGWLSDTGGIALALGVAGVAGVAASTVALVVTRGSRERTVAPTPPADAHRSELLLR